MTEMNACVKQILNRNNAHIYLRVKFSSVPTKNSLEHPVCWNNSLS
jgi:hypothetical protein